MPATLCALALVLATFFFVRVFISKSAPKRTRRALSVAVSSGVFYFCILDPFRIVWRGGLLSKTLSGTMGNWKSDFSNLPFYYAFMMTQFIGEFLSAAYSSILGTLAGFVFMVFLNYCMPGGAGGLTDSSELAYAWIPGGYNMHIAMVLISVTVYCIFLSKTAVGFKQYALSFLSSAFVSFVDPRSQTEAFFWNYKFEINWKGQAIGLMVIVLLSVAFAFLSIPVFVSKRVRRFHSCTVQASNGLAVLAVDTMETLERFVWYFCKEDFDFDNDSTYLYISNLGSRRRNYEALIEQGVWEAKCSERERVRLKRLKILVRFLRSFRQLLRVQISHLKSGSCSKGCARETLPLLSWFRQNVSEAVTSMANPATALMNAEEYEEVLRDVEQKARHADRALMHALKTAPRSTGGDIVFMDNLRTCCTILKDFIRESREQNPEALPGSLLGDADDDDEEAAKPRTALVARLRSWAAPMVTFSWDEHRDALRLLVSWLFALRWSIVYRPYDSTCVSAASFIFSPTLGSTFDRNLNRMVGVGVGLVMGNFPATLLRNRSTQSLETMFIYATIACLSWSFAVYGYLATRTKVGQNWSYACILWAALSGTQALVIYNTESTSPEDRSVAMMNSDLAGEFNSTMDNFLACLIVFVVDISFANLFGKRVTDQVGEALPPCLEACSTLISGARIGDFNEADLETMSGAINHGRYCDEEVHKMDLVWNSLRAAPYKAGLVQTFLDKMDTAYVAAWALHRSAERCASREHAIGILRQVLPSSLPHDCERYAVELSKVLAETEKAQDDSVLDRFHAFHKAMPRMVLERGGTFDGPESPTGVVITEVHKNVGASAASRALHAQAERLRAAVRHTHVLLAEHSLWVAKEVHKFERGDSHSSGTSDEDDDYDSAEP